MSVTITGLYLGNKKIELTHEPSGSKFTTDAPKDNQGEGLFFSPTDLTAASLGSCMLTVMAIYAEHSGIDLSGMKVRVEKTMGASPRRISELAVQIHMPKRLDTVTREKLERVAHTCPIHYSLHPDVAVPTQFIYDLG